ncbi:MAG: 5'-3' exonuclease [Actinomycetota bacterium]
MGTSAQSPLIAVLDGNGLMHRAFHAHQGSDQRNSAGRPVWALRAMVATIAAVAARLRPDALLIAFDCPDGYHRTTDYPEYKACRPPKDLHLTEQLAIAPDLLRQSGFTVVLHPGHEADDVLASTAAHARRFDWRTVLVTSDRDAFALIDHSTSVLRLVSGGLDAAPLLSSADVYRLYGVTPRQYLDFAALRGDPADNMPGVPGIGPVIAARLLATFGTVDALRKSLTHDAVAVVNVTGEIVATTLAAESSWILIERNRRLMRPRSNLAVPDLESTRLPMSFAQISMTLATQDIRLTRCLWALVGETAPSEPWQNAPTELARHREQRASPRPLITQQSPRRRAMRKELLGQGSLF